MKPKKYRKKPVTIEAIQYHPTVNCEEVHDFLGEEHWEEACHEGAELGIETLEGTMTAHPGDWIIKGVQGEFYPCQDSIFQETYEPAEG